MDNIPQVPQEAPKQGNSDATDDSGQTRWFSGDKERASVLAMAQECAAQMFTPPADHRRLDERFKKIRDAMIEEFQSETFTEFLEIDALANLCLRWGRAQQMMEAVALPEPILGKQREEFDSLFRMDRDRKLLMRMLGLAKCPDEPLYTREEAEWLCQRFTTLFNDIEGQIEGIEHDTAQMNHDIAEAEAAASAAKKAASIAVAKVKYAEEAAKILATTQDQAAAPVQIAEEIAEAMSDWASALSARTDQSRVTEAVAKARKVAATAKSAAASAQDNARQHEDVARARAELEDAEPAADGAALKAEQMREDWARDREDASRMKQFLCTLGDARSKYNDEGQMMPLLMGIAAISLQDWENLRAIAQLQISESDRLKYGIGDMERILRERTQAHFRSLAQNPTKLLAAEKYARDLEKEFECKLKKLRDRHKQAPAGTKNRVRANGSFPNYLAAG